MSPILLLAMAAVELPPICADRPAKANGTCTVPVGHVQVEAGLVGWSLVKVAGTRTTVLTLAPTTIKYGLTSSSDLEVAVTPSAKMQVKHGASVSGFGDTLLRYKQRLTTEAASVQVALIPFVKVPTARHAMGNGKVEGGLAVPISFSLPKGVTMTLGPEADLLADADGHVGHLGIINLVNIAGPVAPRLTLAGELWSNFNVDPAGTARQASADASLAYAVSSNMQLDAGANVGLTSDSPDLELYGGLSVRL